MALKICLKISFVFVNSCLPNLIYCIHSVFNLSNTFCEMFFVLILCLIFINQIPCEHPERFWLGAVQTNIFVNHILSFIVNTFVKYILLFPFVAIPFFGWSKYRSFETMHYAEITYATRDDCKSQTLLCPSCSI